MEIDHKPSHSSIEFSFSELSSVKFNGWEALVLETSEASFVVTLSIKQTVNPLMTHDSNKNPNVTEW